MRLEQDIIDCEDYGETMMEEQESFDQTQQVEYAYPDDDFIETEDETTEDVAPTDVPVETRMQRMARINNEKHVKGRLGKLLGKNGQKKMMAYTTKDKLLSIINDNMEDYKRVLDVLKVEDPKVYVAAMTQLTKYIAPTLASVTAEVNAESRITIEDTLKSLSQTKPEEKY